MITIGKARKWDHKPSCKLCIGVLSWGGLFFPHMETLGELSLQYLWTRK